MAQNNYEQINKVVFGDHVLIDLTEDSVTPEKVLSGESFHLASGTKTEGTMPIFDDFARELTTREDECIIPLGYHDGTGIVGISSTEKEKLIEKNIREGVEVLGILGTMSDMEGVKPTEVTLTPQVDSQSITPEELGNYNSIVQVTVEPIPIVETDNEMGGKTVTIGLR